MKKRIILAVVSMVALSIIAFLLTAVMGRRPLKNLEIVAAGVHLIPPDESVEIKDLEQLEELLSDVVIYNRDESYIFYAGQGVTFTITLLDGTERKVMAYNPFIIIDGKGYRCKYEPCEALNAYANRLLNE